MRLGAASAPLTQHAAVPCSRSAPARPAQPLPHSPCRSCLRQQCWRTQHTPRGGQPRPFVTFALQQDRTDNSLAVDIGERSSLQKEELSAEDAAAARRKLWFAAVKPPMYSVCIIPVLVGAALAYYQTGAFAAGRCGGLLLGSICILAWLNLRRGGNVTASSPLNDAFDATTGVDGDKPESVVNLTGNQGGVLALANAFLAAGGLLLWRAVSAAGDSRIGILLCVAIVMGYLYQGPPFRWSYLGLGEPLCFIAFGPLATTAFYLAQVKGVNVGFPVPDAVWAVSVVVGITVTSVLFCSHFHQIEGDRAAGKLSPLVRLGASRALQVLKATVVAPYLLLAWTVYAGLLPITALWGAAVLSVLPGRSFVAFAQDTHQVAELVKPLKHYAIKWHTALGLGLCAGLCLSPLS